MATENSQLADVLTREGFSRRVLTLREEAAASMVAAQKAGNRKEETSWSRALRKLDKLIDRCGLKVPGNGT